MIKKEGLDKFEGSTNRGISSIPLDNWRASFVISKSVGLHIELSIAFS